jgi:hypothetical protein
VELSWILLTFFNHCEVVKKCSILVFSGKINQNESAFRTSRSVFLKRILDPDSAAQKMNSDSDPPPCGEGAGGGPGPAAVRVRRLSPHVGHQV